MSALVFPGLGQIVLKHYKRGIALALTVLLSLVVVAVKALRQAFAILEKIEAQGRIIDMSTISRAAAEASTTSDNLVYNLGLLLIILLWVIGIVDAYRLGRGKDLEEHPTSEGSNSTGS